MKKPPLAQQECEACRPDAPKVPAAEQQTLLADIPGWSIIQRDGIDILTRRYTFPDFASAMAFSVRVGELAEEVGHHPAILTEWGSVNIEWWSHKIRGLHINDFILAARTDDLHAAMQTGNAA